MTHHVTTEGKSATELRVLDAFDLYDGDAARPESGITPLRIAQLVLAEHWDISRCYCPLCVMARDIVASALAREVSS